MKIQYYMKIRWGLAPLALNDAPPLVAGVDTIEIEMCNEYKRMLCKF
jgi:hypothetical protein